MLWIDTNDRLFLADSISQDGCTLFFWQRTNKGYEKAMIVTLDSDEDAEGEMKRISSELKQALGSGKHGIVVKV